MNLLPLYTAHTLRHDIFRHMLVGTKTHQYIIKLPTKNVAVAVSYCACVTQHSDTSALSR